MTDTNKSPWRAWTAQPSAATATLLKTKPPVRRPHGPGGRSPGPQANSKADPVVWCLRAAEYARLCAQRCRDGVGDAMAALDAATNARKAAKFAISWGKRAEAKGARAAANEAERAARGMRK